MSILDSLAAEYRDELAKKIPGLSAYLTDEAPDLLDESINEPTLYFWRIREWASREDGTRSLDARDLDSTWEARIIYPTPDEDQESEAELLALNVWAVIARMIGVYSKTPTLQRLEREPIENLNSYTQWVVAWTAPIDISLIRWIP